MSMGHAAIEDNIPPTCADIFNRFWYCGSPTSQINHIRKHGIGEDCSLYLKDYYTCMSTKLISDREKKEKILQTMNIMKPNPNPNKVWEYKEKPSWE